MKKLLFISTIVISLSSCNRSACDCLKDAAKMEKEFDEAESKNDTESMNKLGDDMERLQKECTAKYTRNDFDKCKNENNEK